MSNSSLPEAVDTTASDAAIPTSSSPAPGVQETPDAPVTDMQIVSSDPATAPTLVDAKPIAPLPPLPNAMGLQPRQRLALQALAAGESTYAAARRAGVYPSTVFRWRKYDPAFIAAFNAWQAHSQQSARDCLAAATEQAARVVLHAIQKGDVRAALEVLKGSRMLKPQQPGPEFARLVRSKLEIEADKTKLFLGGKTSDQKRDERRKAKEQRESKLYFDLYAKTPPLARPITYEAIDKWIEAAPRIATYPKFCSLTITAATAGNFRPLARVIAEYEKSDVEAVLTRLKALPMMLSRLTLSNCADEFAKKLEAQGATVELRPSWLK